MTTKSLSDTAKEAIISGVSPLISGDNWEVEVEVRSYKMERRWGIPTGGKRLVNLERHYFDLPTPELKDGVVYWPIDEDLQCTITGEVKCDETSVMYTVLRDRTPIAYVDYGTEFRLLKGQTLTISFSNFWIGFC